MHIIIIGAGIYYLVMGVWCFTQPGAPFISIAFLFGLAMLIGGLCTIAYFFLQKNKARHLLWRLAEATETAILGGIVLSNAIVSDEIAFLFFSMWAQFSGVLWILESLEIRKEQVKGWYWILGIGILSLAIGIYGMADLQATGLKYVAVIGGIFILKGAGYVAGSALSDPFPKGKFKFNKKGPK